MRRAELAILLPAILDVAARAQAHHRAGRVEQLRASLRSLARLVGDAERAIEATQVRTNAEGADLLLAALDALDEGHQALDELGGATELPAGDHASLCLRCEHPHEACTCPGGAA